MVLTLNHVVDSNVIGQTYTINGLISGATY